MKEKIKGLSHVVQDISVQRNIVGANLGTSSNLVAMTVHQPGMPRMPNALVFRNMQLAERKNLGKTCRLSILFIRFRFEDHIESCKIKT